MSLSTLNINLDGVALLVVEDDASSALMITRLLSKYGARVESAVDGIEGLQKFREQPFSIVITDINMPGMNGLELVSRIKALDPDIQIIATSANRQAECLVAAIELGFNDYILKPIMIEKLLLSVKRCSDIFAVKRQLENEREKFRTVVESMGEGVTIKDLNFKILYQNRAMTEMYGDRTGSACFNIFGLESPCQECPIVLTLKDGLNHSACRSLQLEGKTFYIESSASLLRDSQGNITGSVEIIRDISERIKNEQTIHDLAFLDPLTGLANRRLFEDRLEQVIAKSRRYDKQFGLLSLDLDNFKEINDTFGHEAGDQVLIEAAERIRACCKRDLDTISRQGGDEFCIIFTDCGGKDNLAAVAENLLEEFARPFQLTDTLVKVTTSIGISIFPDNGTEMKKLEVASDRAMYAAKRAGRNTYRFSLPETG
jgi:diguanylate cyclase (GGDEF)-like protein